MLCLEFFVYGIRGARNCVFQSAKAAKARHQIGEEHASPGRRSESVLRVFLKSLAIGDAVGKQTETLSNSIPTGCSEVGIRAD
jgi:hypothetical protein